MIYVLLLLLVGASVVLTLALLWTTSRILRPDSEYSGVDPIVGARDRVAVYRPSGALIQPHPNVLVPMPNDLKTREEMVAWMTKEMPKLIEYGTRRAA